MMILAGDIGGTNTRLSLYRVTEGNLGECAKKTYPSREHEGLTSIVQLFTAEHSHRIDHACFGISGPVQNGRGKPSNLPWVVDSAIMASQLQAKSASLINDLEANAYGIAALRDSDFAVLNEGASGAVGNAAVISAGTGLGEAGLYWDGKRHHPFACEGGHADFSPRNELEIELLRYLLKSYAHVSYERVLSGPGLRNIYNFLRDTRRGKECPEVVDAMHTQDPSAVIAQAALAERCELCVQALEIFVTLYGAAAGNFALKTMATGGVFVGGGIAPKIIEKLKGPAFMQAFTDKGRLSLVCAAIPVKVILNPNTALMGTARYAAMQASLLN
ncbi:MAG: glucokinase [Burkholderiales bacterium]